MPTESFYNPNTRRYETRETGEAITQTGEMRLKQLEGEQSQEQVQAAGGLGAAAARAKAKKAAPPPKPAPSPTPSPSPSPDPTKVSMGGPPMPIDPQSLSRAVAHIYGASQPSPQVVQYLGSVLSYANAGMGQRRA